MFQIPPKQTSLASLPVLPCLTMFHYAMQWNCSNNFVSLFLASFHCHFFSVKANSLSLLCYFSVIFHFGERRAKKCRIVIFESNIGILVMFLSKLFERYCFIFGSIVYLFSIRHLHRLCNHWYTTLIKYKFK